MRYACYACGTHAVRIFHGLRNVPCSDTHVTPVTQSYAQSSLLMEPKQKKVKKIEPSLSLSDAKVQHEKAKAEVEHIVELQ